MALSSLEYLMDLALDAELNHRRNRHRYNDLFDLYPLDTLDIVRPKLKSRFSPYNFIIQKLQDFDNTGINRRSPKDTDGGKLSGFGKEGFQACLNVEHFAPNELTVKIVDGCIVVEGKHGEQSDDYGFISRQFQRRFILPHEYDVNSVTSSLSSDGILTIHVPRPKKLEETNEKIIQIQQTGPAHLTIKENHKEECGEGDKPDKKDSKN